MVIPAGVEPAIFWMRTRRPRPLDDGTEVRTKRKFIFFSDERGFVSRVAASGTNVYSIPYLYKNAKISYNNSYEKASYRSVNWANQRW